MIEVTVRTLNSVNHNFSVDDAYTVLQFKQHIASTVEVAVEIQRIIYCGRVLSDEAKLSDLDVHGKVVHLVERPPPSDNQTENGTNRSTRSPQHQQQPHQHRVLGGNAMYLGSMAIPFEPQNLVPPPPTFRLAASRLNVARRMLRRAEAAIALLENPASRPAPPPQPDEAQVESTPVFEARVIVPASSGENIDETLMNAVHSSLLSNAENLPTEENAAAAGASTHEATREEAAEGEENSSASGTPLGQSTPVSTSNEDLPGDTQQERPRGDSRRSRRTSGQENISRTSEMADLLDTLTRLQERFAPFLANYQDFMRDDPVVETDDVRTTDRTLNRVSEVMHLLGHAYHSLSDMILRVRSAPPRRLFCRPILIQQTAVVPAGFPIQVEAQINFATDPPTANATSANSATQTSNSSTTTTTTAETGNANSAPNTNRTSRVTIPQMEFINRLGLQTPPGAVHVQTIPIGIRTMRGSGNRPAGANAAGNTTHSNNAPPQGQEANAGNPIMLDENIFGNPNIEVFMEVTPESITIDSLETTLLGGTAGEGGARVTSTQPPPEFIQSIMQMVMNRGASTSNVNVNVTSQPSQASAQATQTQPQSQATTTQQPNNSVPGQNSQARGNTQTNPTTSTHTRSTARPHVHFAQHAIQGFDPFLPCNSHHIMHLRRPGARNAATATQMNNNNSRPQNGNMNMNMNPPGNQFNPVYSLVQGVLNSLQNIYGRRGGPPAPGTGQQSTATTASATGTGAPPPPVNPNVNDNANAASEQSAQHMMQSAFFANLPNFLLPHFQSPNASDPNARGPTLAQLLQNLGDPTTEGEGVFNDVITLLSRNFTITDILQLNSGRLDPLLRIRNEIRTFVTERILEGNAATPSNVERAVNKLLGEMQPFLDDLAHLPVRDDIDIVRSTQMLFRTRLPNVINLAVSRRPNSMKCLVDHLKLIWRHLCALILHSSATGHLGVENILNRLVASYMDGVSPDIQQWTQVATVAQFREFIVSSTVPASALQPYIVRNVDSVTPIVPEPENVGEPMDVDALQANAGEFNAGASNNVLGAIELDPNEELPEVVLGSESWHGQVPADWVPIITRDQQRQRRQSAVPLSDGYLSGMPNKRRKVVTNNKPQGTLPQVISESIRRAATATGLASVGNLEEVAQEAGADLNIQSAYRDLLRTSVQSSIQDNEDFTPERFPNASTYFSKPQ